MAPVSAYRCVTTPANGAVIRAYSNNVLVLLAAAVATASCSSAAASPAFAVATWASAIRSRPAASSRSCWATRFGRLLSTPASRGEVRDLVRGLCALEVCFRAIDLLAAPPRGRLVLGDFVSQFGNLENGEQLAGLHPVADVDVDHLQITRHFGVDVNFLKRAELG